MRPGRVEGDAVNVRVAAPSISRPELPRLSPRTLVAIPVVLAALVGGWFWLRDSSLVAVDRVVVTGGKGAPAARSALDSAAREMTTLNFDPATLRASVARFSIVRGIEVTSELPHTLRITIDERRAVGAIVAAGTRVAVGDDGVLLRDTPSGGLPVIPARVPPGGARVVDRVTLARVALLAAAPASLRSRILRVIATSDGLVVHLDGDKVLRFGGSDRLVAKWIAVRRVLTDPAAQTATYIDVRVPERPAAGGVSADLGGSVVQRPVVAAPAVVMPPTGATGATAAVAPTPAPAPRVQAPAPPATTAPAAGAVAPTATTTP